MPHPLHRHAARLFCLALLMLCGMPAPGHAETRLRLRPEMVLNETALGDATKLVDEQDAVGEPASGKGIRPQSPFFPGWAAWQYPIHVLIDLGAARPLTRLFLFNESGDNDLLLGTGHPFAWNERKIVLSGYRQWCEIPVHAATRYLRLTLLRPTSLPELVVYADGPEPPPPMPARPRQARIRATMDSLIGTNGFIDDPVEKLATPAGFVREYHNWSWDTEGADGQVRFQPSGAAGGHAWCFDDFYAHLKAAGVTVCPAVQGSSPVYFPGSDTDAKPIHRGDDPEAPASYRIHAAHLFQYAARYGHTPVAASKLHLAHDQPRRSGLGSLRYIENWNEPDKTWRGRDAYFAPYELAALCSADYDGDQGRLGDGAGVRDADPTMHLVMGGLAGLNLDYLRAMKVWADAYRRGDFPADVINLHHYSSTGNEQGFQPHGHGISPEDDHLKEKLGAIAAWRDANVPKCELWVTEFGYDTNPGSPLHAPAIGSYTAEEVQALWLVRSYLALAAAGVDRAAMFMFRDTRSDGAGVFETCGLVTEKGQWRPKPAYFYVATLKRRLTGMRFAGDVPSGRKDVRIYRFATPSGKSAYVLWCPTSMDQRVPGVSLAVRGRTATRVDFVSGSTTGKPSPLTVRQGKISVEAREKPVIVLVP